MSDNWQTDYEAEQAEQRKRAQGSLQKACDELARLGVQSVTVDYDGVGDSGSIENVTFDPAPNVAVPKTLQDQIEEAAYELLPGGWELNEGSFGTLTIDVQARKACQEHSWRVVNTEDDEVEFDL